MNTPATRTELELAPRESAVARALPTGELSIQAAFRAIVDGDLDAAKLSVMKELLAMSAEREFAAAFVALQSDLPTITATTPIPNRGKYEKFEDVMRVVGPLLVKHGFTVSFSMDFKESRIAETCQLQHIGGHSRSNSFAVRTRKADSDTQADCMAATTAKRNALLNALNIVIRQDCLADESDARNEGGAITPEQAAELEHRVQMTNSDRAAFLKFAQAATFNEIASAKYEMLDANLRRKEAKGR